MSPTYRPLCGLRIGLSVSGTGEDMALRGFTESGLNRLTIRLSRVLLAEGAALAFGHDWREGGVMEAVASIALDYEGPTRSLELGPPIINVIPWPDTISATDPALLSKLKGVVEVIPAGLPEDLLMLEEQAFQAGRLSEEWRYLRARGLTHLRRLLVERCHVRVVLGGKLGGAEGRLPGIIEEAFVSLSAKQPIYLAGLLGGASEILGRILLGEGSSEVLRQTLKDFAQSPLAKVYSRHAEPTSSGLADSDLNVEAILGLMEAASSRACLHTNGLTKAENFALLTTDLEEETVSLILRGLKKRWNPQARNFLTQTPKSKNASVS
jgi:hypothetical protein